MKTIKVFTKQDCPNCPQAKQAVEDFCKEHKEVELELYDVGTVNGLTESAFYDVFSTPTVLVLKDDREAKRIIGVVREEDLK